MSDAAPLAAVLLAHDAGGTGDLAMAAQAARDAGAHPVVVVLPRGAEAPAETRVARVGDTASTISALRAGMALLTNTPARLALVWPLAGAPADAGQLVALVAAARRDGAALTVLAAHDLDHSPVIVARDAWLELMTLGEQGLGAVAARRGSVEVRGGS